MSIGILHISDIHLKGTEREVENWARAIESAVRTRCTTLSVLLVVISGDIAFSGKTTEYDRANQFIESLFLSLKKMDHLRIMGPVLVPGNHDCNFAKEDDVRPLLLNSLSKRLEELDLEGRTVEQLVGIQDEFFAFERSYSSADRRGVGRLYYSSLLESNGVSILVHCFNTAWVSQMKEAKNGIVFPESIKPVPNQSLPSLTVSVFHHPYAWFETRNGKRFSRVIEGGSDVVLTGHEHDGDSYSRESSSGEHVQYVEGAALNSVDSPSGFNLVIVDSEAKTYEVLPFAINAGFYEPRGSRTLPFARNPRLLGQYFENNSEFRRELSTLGGTFTHPVKQELEINDLFVYPDLQIRSLIDKKDTLVSSANILDFIVKNKHVQISGGALSGKTTLAKKLYADVQDKFNYVPVLIQGEELKGDWRSAVPAASERAFRKQYSPDALERFRNLEFKRRALIIDDWNLSRFNSKARAEMLALAKIDYEVIITLSADGSWLQEVLESGAAEQIADFRHCEIKEFGFRLRGQLVTNWHSLGTEFDFEESEIVHLISESENLLDSVIGKGVVPSHPFFILYVLQESQLKGQSTVMHGSYGHVYEALLTVRLAKVSNKAGDLGTKFTYLSMVAYKLFEIEEHSLTPELAREVHEKFKDEYGLPIEKEKMMRDLVEARILGHSGENIGFLHKYCYYFFVAKHLQKAIANYAEAASIRELLHRMADMVHDDEYMNILIFYIYLTEDRLLIERIISNARQIYGEYEPCDLESDVDFIANLWKPRTIEVNTGNIRDNRDDYNSRRDEIDSKPEERLESTRTRYDKSLKNVLKTDFAFKSIQVMGQVLRNFPGDLKADLKYQLAEESYRLGLRSLKGFLVEIESAVGLLRSFIETKLASYRARPREELSEDAGQVIAVLSELAIYGTIKRISFSVGLEELRETYESVRENAGLAHLPTRLIDLSIRLDHFSQVPMTDIEELAKIPKTKIVPHTILRLLVADHLYLFPVDYKDRQRLATKLGLEIKKHLVADKKVRSRKPGGG